MNGLFSLTNERDTQMPIQTIAWNAQFCGTKLVKRSRWLTSVCLALSYVSAFHASAEDPVSVTPGTLTLLRIGIDPDSLALAGAPVEAFHALDQALSGHQAALSQWLEQDERCAEQKKQLAQIQLRAETEGVSSSNTQEALGAAQRLESVESLERASHLELLDLLLPATEQLLSTEQRAILMAAATNARRKVPPEYRVLQLASAQWTMLESASETRRASAVACTADESAILNWADAQPAVIAARTRHAQHVGAMAQSFAASLGTGAAP